VAVYGAAIVSFVVDVIFGSTAVEVADNFSVVVDNIVIFGFVVVCDVCDSSVIFVVEVSVPLVIVELAVTDLVTLVAVVVAGVNVGVEIFVGAVDVVIGEIADVIFGWITVVVEMLVAVVGVAVLVVDAVALVAVFDAVALVAISVGTVVVVDNVVNVCFAVVFSDVVWVDFRDVSDDRVPAETVLQLHMSS